MRAVKVLLDLLEGLQHLGHVAAVVDLPVLLGGEANPGPVGPATLVGAAEGGRRRPSGRDQLGDGQSRAENLGLEGGDVLRPRSVVIDRGHGVLPQLWLGNPRAEVTRDRSHVAVEQLVPRLGRTRPPVCPGARGSAWRSARRSDPSSGPGPSSASWGRAASRDREHPARCPGPRDPWASTAGPRPGLVVSSQS